MNTLVKTVIWTVVNMVFHVGIGVFLAVILHQKFIQGRSVWRVLLILPWALPQYITALTWRGMFNYEYGAINLLIVKYLHLPPVQWLTSPLEANWGRPRNAIHGTNTSAAAAGIATLHHHERFSRPGVVARAAQTELVIFERLVRLALMVVALADVVHQVGVGRLQLQRHLEALARVLVLAALVKVDAFLAKLLHALVHIRQTPRQRRQDEQGK